MRLNVTTPQRMPDLNTKQIIEKLLCYIVDAATIRHVYDYQLNICENSPKVCARKDRKFCMQVRSRGCIRNSIDLQLRASSNKCR